MRLEEFATWDGSNSTWGGRGVAFGTVLVCVRVQERAGEEGLILAGRVVVEIDLGLKLQRLSQWKSLSLEGNCLALVDVLSGGGCGSVRGEDGESVSDSVVGDCVVDVARDGVGVGDRVFGEFMVVAIEVLELVKC
nr:hypothetical protein [Tanacetum cinerariifolium]